MELPFVEVELSLDLVLCMRVALLSTAFTCVLPIIVVRKGLGGGGCNNPHLLYSQHMPGDSSPGLYIGSTVVVAQHCKSPHAFAGGAKARYKIGQR